MSSRTRILLGALPLLALVIAFWLLVMGPKREQVSDLEAEATELRGQVDQQEQAAVAAEEARRDFPRAYRRLVVLGKATPNDDDTASLMVQLDRIAADTGVDFLSLEASTDGEAAAPPPAPAEPQTPADAAESSEQQVASAESGTSPLAPPTEASAASLPIGASIGPAGLPIMKYTLGFEGGFFDLADFLARIDDLVDTRNSGGVGVRGRLFTIDGFELIPTGAGPDPTLTASFEVTTYLTPADEGATAGADPAGPAPATEPQPVGGTASAPSSGTATASATTP